MFRFLIRLLIVALVGSLIIWVGLGKMKESNGSFYRTLVSIFVSSSGKESALDRTMKHVQNKVSNTVENAKNSSAAVRAVADATARAAAATVQATERLTSQAVTTVQTLSDGTVQTNEYASLADVPAGAQVVMVQEDLGPDERAAKNKDPGYEWALVVTNSFCYDANMKKAGILKGGTVIETMSDRMLPHGKVWSIKAMKDWTWQEKTLVMYEADIIRFGIPYSEMTDRRQRDTLIDFCTWYGRFEELRGKQLKKASGGENPYAAQYEANKPAWDELNAEVAKYVKLERETMFKNVPGVNRGDVMKKCNLLRIKQKELEKTFKPIKEKYEAWEEEHQQVDVPITVTPEMKELIDRMNSVRSLVDEWVPGLFPPNLP